jgi:hypothetical protein
MGLDGAPTVYGAVIDGLATAADRNGSAGALAVRSKRVDAHPAMTANGINTRAQ